MNLENSVRHSLNKGRYNMKSPCNETNLSIDECDYSDNSKNQLNCPHYKAGKCNLKKGDNKNGKETKTKKDIREANKGISSIYTRKGQNKKG